MRLHGWTWAALGMGLVLLLAANLWCWLPGIGGGRPARSGGTEVELYYGWPATFQAEWWRSDDPSLVLTLLKRAPFFHPAGKMALRARYTGRCPALADAAFAAAVLVILGVSVESQVRGWRRGMLAPLLAAVAALAGLWAVAGAISVHL